MVGNVYIKAEEKDQGQATATFYHDTVTKGGLFRYITPRNEDERKAFEKSDMDRVTVMVTFSSVPAKKAVVTKLIKKGNLKKK